ncbi:hypothetical protein MSG28_007891 [Choristoneura fumiferana]|uniref:Uncharacterized protein n=2 Tax=Choristoneura fumiferana TaxID=7141 RepID=A0ACC0J955_CHOFU|nr:hypothetical protein MSG28_007891 [Choristoneura fumiferana]KAI8420651.1 hypothetical protein MSG28_007891 [Choristoneura fumiferana]
MMEISKPFFAKAYPDLDCNVLLHPWNESCVDSIPYTYMHSFIGSAKFYSLIYAAQIAMRGKKLKNKEEWIKMGQYYARSTLLGAVVCGTCCTLGCVLRRMLGSKFQYHAIFLIPSTINGVCIYLEPPSRRSLVINLFSSLTLMFMLSSAFLFYLMRLEGDKKERTPLFWLFTPEKVKWKNDNEKDDSPCPHSGPCLRHIFKGTVAYFGVGTALTLARVILPKIGSPLRALSSIQPKHFRMGLFFGSYIGIYRLYSTILYEKKVLPSNVPLPELLYCICQGTLFHARFLHPETCPSYMFKLTDGVSNGRTKELSDNIQAVARMALSIGL